MALPSPDEFATLLATRPLEDLVHAYVFAGEVFAFIKIPNAQGVLQKRLAGSLGVQRDNIRVVGSAKIGFSLDPNRFSRAFQVSSDLDVAIVSDELFDRAWHTVLEWHYLRRHKLPNAEFAWAMARKENFYWGYIVPDKVRFVGLQFPKVLTPLRDLSALWFTAFRELGTEPLFATRNVNGRLYRTWDHALRYHVHGLERIRHQLRKRKG